VARVCGGRGGRVRAAARRRRAVSKSGDRRERRGPNNFEPWSTQRIASRCHAAAASHRSARGRVRPSLRPLGVSFARQRSRAHCRYRFRPPLFARARLPARASHRRWSPIRIRRCSSTPHPVSITALNELTRKLVFAPGPSSAPFRGALGQKRAPRVPRDVILQRANKLG
jgi:hypothetical protein